MNEMEYLERMAESMSNTPFAFEIAEEVHNTMNRANGMVIQRGVVEDADGVVIEYQVRHKLGDNYLDEWVSGKYLTKGHRPE